MAFLIVAAAAVALIFVSSIVFAVISFIAKHRSVAVLKLMPGPKPNVLFGNALQLPGEADGEFYQVTYKGRLMFILFGWCMHSVIELGIELQKNPCFEHQSSDQE